jgi:uncharacterized protein YukJ
VQTHPERGRHLFITGDMGAHINGLQRNGSNKHPIKNRWSSKARWYQNRDTYCHIFQAFISDILSSKWSGMPLSFRPINIRHRPVSNPSRVHHLVDINVSPQFQKNVATMIGLDKTGHYTQNYWHGRVLASNAHLHSSCDPLPSLAARRV